MSSVDIVVKVGGSLYGLPNLAPRLQRWLHTLASRDVLLVPGGGAIAGAIRDLDRWHHLGEERSHWLALQGLGLNARFLATLLPDCPVVEEVVGDGVRGGWRILDPYRFARADERRSGCLPHHWDVTSDSIAARAAHVAGAGQLVLLKSVPIPPDLDWGEAGRKGLVDPCFAETVGRSLSVRAVNFRAWRPEG